MKEAENLQTAETQALNIPVVSNRREQLMVFLEYCDSAGWIKNVDKNRIIDDFLKNH